MELSIKSFLLSLIILPIIDSPWLYVQKYLGLPMFSRIQGSPVKLSLWPTVVVYFALALLLIQHTTMLQAVICGSLVYAVYDFTNLAVFKDYSLTFALLDTTWGGILSGITFYLVNKILTGI